MIGKIKGVISEIDGNVGLIETSSGVYYQVFLPACIASRLDRDARGLPAPVEIYTYLQIRDDAHVLFGFENKKQLALFKLLISVSGIGPKTGFNIISVVKEDELIAAIKQNDIAYFSSIPGLGKKTAMKIILELSQKMKEEFNLEKMYLSEDDKIVVDALVSLGFTRQEGQKILSTLPKDLSVEKRISYALRKVKK